MVEPLPNRALPPIAYERNDVSLRFIIGLFALIGVTLLLTLGLVVVVYPDMLADRRFAQPFPDFPSPRLQASPPAEMRAFAAEERARLESAGWVDRTTGTVHIPIEQAMLAIATEGISGWPTPAGTKQRASLASDGERH